MRTPCSCGACAKQLSLFAGTVDGDLRPLCPAIPSSQLALAQRVHSSLQRSGAGHLGHTSCVHVAASSGQGTHRSHLAGVHQFNRASALVASSRAFRLSAMVLWLEGVPWDVTVLQLRQQGRLHRAMIDSVTREVERCLHGPNRSACYVEGIWGPTQANLLAPGDLAPLFDSSAPPLRELGLQLMAGVASGPTVAAKGRAASPLCPDRAA